MTKVIASRNTSFCTAAAVILVAPGTAWSQVDTSDWKCELCPFEQGYRADYEAGATYVSDSSAKFGDATGYDEEGAYINLDGEGHFASDGGQMEWYIEDLGLDSRVVEGAGGQQGLYGVRIGYRELPYREFDTTSTIFLQSAPDLLDLPAGWVRAPQTGGFTELANALYAQNIGSDRQFLELGAHYLPTSSVKLFADYRQQQRDGVDIVTGSSYTQASYLARPIDQQTDEIDLGARYVKGKMNLTLAYYGSFFKNNIDSLTWASPFTSAPGADFGRMATEPDNDFQQLSLSGSYRDLPMNTSVALSLAMGRGEQNDALLPYTVNPNIVTTPLPRSTLDGKVDTANYALTILSRPVEKARLKFAFRQDERDNQTPQALWSRVITDSFTSGESETNLPYSYQRMRLGLSGEYRLLDTLDVAAGYDRVELDRDFQEVAEQDEDGGWGQLRWRPNSMLDIRARGGASKRDIDRYDTTVAESYGQNPLMRKYNLAYRFRQYGELTISATPAEKPWSLGVSMLYADDSYTQSQLGLTDSSDARFTADLGWSVSDRTSLYVTGGVENIDSEQLGSEFSGPADWSATHEDSFYHFGGGFTVIAIADKFDLTLDYTHSDGQTEIDVASTSTATSPLPDLESTLDSLRLELRYKHSERMDFDLDLRYERFDSADWALDGVQPDTMPTILTMGADAYNYRVWAVGLSFRYRIGAAAITFPE